MTNKVLIISPHPDDLEIGMGGTVAKMVKEGTAVTSLVVTDGRGSTNVFSCDEDELAGIREKEVMRSCEILGVHSLEMLRLSNVRDYKNLSVLSERFAELIESNCFDEVFLPHPEKDKHQTHRVVSGLFLETMERILPVKNDLCSCWCYEVWTPFDTYERIEDITGFINLKSDAIDAHVSQTAYRSYREGILGLNRYRAVFHETSGKTDMEYAEIFIRKK